MGPKSQASATSTSAAPPPPTRKLLPKDVTPINYDLHLTPDLDNKTFGGVVKTTVQVNAKEGVKAITLHSKDIVFNEEKVTFTPSSGKTAIACTGVVFEEKDDTATLTFASVLPSGKGVLAISYDGRLNDQMCGFYSSSYTNAKGEKRNMASTQMEPTDARRALPCWDEPALKATFDVTVTHPADRIALSNMDVAKDEPAASPAAATPSPSKKNKKDKDNKDKDKDKEAASTSAAAAAAAVTSNANTKTVRFNQTPKMSTYLLAIVVGEFEYIESKTKEGVVVRVFTRIGSLEQAKFSLDVATAVLSFFTDYFKIGYPLPKCDMIAIPDFAAGAMENWGLITYRETALLIDPANSSVAQKLRVAYVVAHELAHQWFGNLVSPEWWKELWLNEGFATWVGNLATDHLFPEWEVWTQFVTSYFASALSLDSMVTSHPIEVEVSDSAQVNEIFDRISYDKGSCVIRMIAEYLGEDAFKRGLHNYLKKHEYGNAVTKDLWQALSGASDKDVARLMNGWTSQTGYPVVTVKLEDGGKSLAVSQQRFLANGRTDVDGKWIIGVNTLRANGSITQHSIELDETRSLPISVSATDKNDWIKLNAGQSGFYRVKYSAELQERLREPITAMKLSAVDRLGVQNDAFALAQADMLETAAALDLASAYVNDSDFAVWSDLSANLGVVGRVWQEEPNYKQIQVFMRDIYLPISRKLGWDPRPNEPALDAMLRPLVLGFLSGCKDEDTVEIARKKFAAFLKDESSLSPDLRGLVYRIVVQFGGLDEYEAVLNIYRTSTLQEEKIRALRALGHASDDKLLARTLEMSLTPSEVRTQDTVYVIIAASSDAKGRTRTWEFFKKEFARFNAAFGSGQFLLASIIKSMCSGFTTEAMAVEIEDFFKQNPVPPAARTVTQVAETIRVQAKWLNSQRGGVAQYLDTKVPALAGSGGAIGRPSATQETLHTVLTIFATVVVGALIFSFFRK